MAVSRLLLTVCAAWAGLAADAIAAVDLGSYKGCAASDMDFDRVTLAAKGTATDQPLKMGFTKRADGTVDVFLIERMGGVKKYDGATKTLSLVGTVPAATGNEDGLTGLAVDPEYQRNKYLYFFYAFQGPGDTSFHVSRMTVGADEKLDLASEKVLVRVPSKRNLPHTGGAMQFDAYGDLWITVGDNGVSEVGAGNTADMRGGILRIHPDDRLASGYSIPKGNFGSHFAAHFRGKGNESLAKEYEDPAKVRPEIYIKGTRNAYTVSLDPVRRWLAWGDVGPDFGGQSEETNLMQAPAFAGWPYFAGKLSPGNVYGTNFGVKDRAAPVNASGVAGVKNLPPNQEPIHVRPQACAMTGPVFRYDGSNPYPGQIPPQLDRKWLIGDCNGSYGNHLLTLNAKGDSVVGDVKAFDLINVAVMVDMQQGPDGAIYYIGWQSGLFRLDYKGTCKDAALLPEKTGCADASDPKYDPKLNPAFHDPRQCGNAVSAKPLLASAPWLALRTGGFDVSAAGSHAVRLVDVRGRTVFSARGDGPRSYALPAGTPPGILRLLAETREGRVSVPMARLTRR
jgi:cytochrome c